MYSVCKKGAMPSQSFIQKFLLFFVIVITSTLSAEELEKPKDASAISVGLGFRSSFNTVENGASNGKNPSNNFNINNARVYLNGTLMPWLKFELNTDCVNCATQSGAGPFQGGSQNMAGNSALSLLDAIAKLEFHETANLWVGRLLLPSERGELSGPFYTATFDAFRTPLYPADLSANFNAPSTSGGGAGLYGRDNGATFWGKVHPFGTHLLYVATISQGLRGASNQANNPMFTGRLAWNFWDDEPGPGYYAAGTYFGKAGDILALGGSVQHQKDGTGNAAGATANFTGTTVDFLLEKIMPQGAGVFTLNGEFKRFWAEYGTAAFTSPAAPCFCVFNGYAWSATMLYLIPSTVGAGQFQPYVRFTSIHPQYSSMREELEYGTNYVILGHKARLALYARYGDLESKGGGSFTGTAAGRKIHSVNLAAQLQY